MTVVLILLIILCVILQGFFSGSELALVSADRVAIRAAQESGGRSAKLLGRFLEDPERILTTSLIGTNLSVVSATTLFATLTHRFAAEMQIKGEVLTVIVLAPLVLLFGEFLPKSVFRRYSSRIAPVVIHPLTWLSVVFYPAVILVRSISAILMRVLGGKDNSGMTVSRDELRLLLQFDASQQASEEGDEEAIEETEREMIHRIFAFPEVIVREVMRPLIDVVAISEDKSLKEAASLFLESGYSRIPVYHDRVDDIVGMLRARELLAEDLNGPSFTHLVRALPYVPETQKVDQLLTNLQRSRQGMAIVVDEYGGAQGLVTIEDILEEIVGEIEDEHDEPAPDIHQRGEAEYLVSARVEVDRLNEQLGLGLEEGTYETLAGYLLEHLGQIPRAGDQHRSERAVFTIVSATSRMVEKVQIVLDSPSPTNDDDG